MHPACQPLTADEDFTSSGILPIMLQILKPTPLQNKQHQRCSTGASLLIPTKVHVRWKSDSVPPPSGQTAEAEPWYSRVGHKRLKAAASPALIIPNQAY